MPPRFSKPTVATLFLAAFLHTGTLLAAPPTPPAPAAPPAAPPAPPPAPAAVPPKPAAAPPVKPAAAVPVKPGAPGSKTPPAPPPPPPVARDAADDWVDKGNAAYDARKMEEAEAAFGEAWKLRRSLDIASRLGQAQLELGKAPLAANQWARALKNAAPSETPEARADVKARLEGVRKQVGSIRINVNEKGAVVTLGGETLDKAALEDELFVAAGALKLRASLPGHSQSERGVHVAPGESKEVLLTLLPLEKDGTVAGLTDPNDSSKPVLIVGLATAGVGLVLGVAFTVVANGKADDAVTQWQAVTKAGGLAACTKTSADCTALHDVLGARATFSDVALFSFVGAGLVGAGTATYYFNAHHAGAKTASVRAAPLVSASGGGLVIAGTW